ncbi:MAG: class I SAM-dependent methyltransferase [Limisphaerales bacterium]
MHFIPLRNQCVDSVLSVAVLEHTRIPWECTRELWRVLKPGGTAVIGVPFLQPEHSVPHDFFRYTVYGLQSMLEWAGFNVDSVERLGRQHRALAWVLLEMYHASPRLGRCAITALATAIARRARTGSLPPFSVYTASYAIARKPETHSGIEAPETHSQRWFWPLLLDPISKSPLKATEAGLCNPEGSLYALTNGIPDLRPKAGLSQDARVPWASHLRKEAPSPA